MNALMRLMLFVFRTCGGWGDKTTWHKLRKKEPNAKNINTGVFVPFLESIDMCRTP
jgi:hypothetical protein